MYIACELGIPLEEYLLQEKLDDLFNFNGVIPILSQLIEIGLLLESKKISHCDITPDAYVFVPETGDIKITDFGFIKKSRLAEDLAAPSLERNLNPEFIQIPGFTVQFLGPELMPFVNNPAMRKKISNVEAEFNRADVFSVGLVFLYILIRCDKQMISQQYPKHLNEWKDYFPPKIYALLCSML